MPLSAAEVLPAELWIAPINTLVVVSVGLPTLI